MLSDLVQSQMMADGGGGQGACLAKHRLNCSGGRILGHLPSVCPPGPILEKLNFFLTCCCGYTARDQPSGHSHSVDGAKMDSWFHAKEVPGTRFLMNGGQPGRWPRAEAT